MKPAPWKNALEAQLLAAIDMLESAIQVCPPRIWVDDATPIERQYWYLAYHTIFWLDRYLSPSPDMHVPPKPFTMGELDPDGVYPEHPYTPDQLLEYLEYARARCRARFLSLEDASAAEQSPFKPGFSVAEFIMYSLRHVQHHVAQLNLILRQGGAEPVKWVSRGQGAKQTV